MSEAILPFRVWKDEVNKQLIQLSGRGIDDYAEYDYRNAWDWGMSPRSMALWVIEADEDQDLCC